MALSLLHDAYGISHSHRSLCFWSKAYPKPNPFESYKVGKLCNIEMSKYGSWIQHFLKVRTLLTIPSPVLVLVCKHDWGFGNQYKSPHKSMTISCQSHKITTSWKTLGVGSSTKHPTLSIVPQILQVQSQFAIKRCGLTRMCIFHGINVSPTYVTPLFASASSALLGCYQWCWYHQCCTKQWASLP